MICGRATIDTESGACFGDDGFRPMDAMVVLDGAGFSWLAPVGLVALCWRNLRHLHKPPDIEMENIEWNF
ncbi:hypothetical protein D5047_06435 [Verminephrobacter eiseniae]|nr:hypothetical protein [Verminephrobacter eiseniae]